MLVSSIELYNRTVRYERLSLYSFESVEPVQDFASHFLITDFLATVLPIYQNYCHLL
jgi:hypothetical protein